VVGPRTLERAKGQPITDVTTFSAAPGAFYVDLDDLASQGADGIVVLNGVTLLPARNSGDLGPRHYIGTATLGTTNTLEARLLGKPGSQLRIAIWPVQVVTMRLVLEGVYPEGTGIPYAVSGQVVNGAVQGDYALRLGDVYPWIPNDIGKLTCLVDVQGVLVAAMYPSLSFGPSYASYVIVKDPHGTPLVWVGGAGGGDPPTMERIYCDPTTLPNFINTTPAWQFKPGVTRLEY
jgi:hypothetical protein